MNPRMMRNSVAAAVVAAVLFPGAALASDASASPLPAPSRPASAKPFVPERHTVPERHFVPERHLVGERHYVPERHVVAEQHKGASHVRPSTLPAVLPHAVSRHHRRPTAHAQGRVVTWRVPLKVRSGPGTGYRVIGAKRSGNLLDLAYKVRGTKVRGNRIWYKLAHAQGYVSARYVLNSSSVPWR